MNTNSSLYVLSEKENVLLAKVSATVGLAGLAFSALFIPIIKIYENVTGKPVLDNKSLASITVGVMGITQMISAGGVISSGCLHEN